MIHCTYRPHLTRTCSGCEETGREMFSVTIGSLTFALCGNCLSMFKRLARRAERKRDKPDEDVNTVYPD